MLVFWTHLKLVSGQQKEEERKEAALGKTGHIITYMQSPSWFFRGNFISREKLVEHHGLAVTLWQVFGFACHPGELRVQLGSGFCTDRRHSHNALPCICMFYTMNYIWISIVYCLYTYSQIMAEFQWMSDDANRMERLDPGWHCIIGITQNTS